MHIRRVTLQPHNYPTREHYPFNLATFHETRSIDLVTPLTFFVGENGTGKSTLLEAISHRCGIHIWEHQQRTKIDPNPYEKKLYTCVGVQWVNGSVPGSFFSGEIFRDFACFLEEWALQDPNMLDYFGGRSLLNQSHGQSLMSYFQSRYRIKGFYILDEPETALSPANQLRLLKLLCDMSRTGRAQFLVASHSPILLGCPGATIYNFDASPIKPIAYEKTDHYRVYQRFMQDRETVLSEL